MTPRFLQHLTASVTFVTLTDLHVGTGGVGMFCEMLDNGQEEDREYALFARDHDNNVFIPGSGLKGAMRALAGSEADFLFGKSPVEGVEGETGEGGRLVPMMAALTGKRCRSDLPYWEYNKQTWLRIRHARNRETMTVDAESRKLFNTELVPPDVEFTGKILFMGDEDALREKVLPLLERMSRPEGFSLGASRNIMGRVRLKPGKIMFLGQSLVKQDDGDNVLRLAISKSSVDLDIADSSDTVANLTLKFPGPVTILDPERTEKVGEGEEQHDVQKVLQYCDGQLAGFETALRQALRQRCAWLEVTENWDARNCLDDPDQVLNSTDEIKDLTSTQRLFGITGLRGLVSVHLVTASGDKNQTFPGIALDRLTGGLLHRAIFFIEAPVGAKANFLIEMDTERHNRKIFNDVHEADLALLKRLSDDVARRGIKLGRHVSSGFGWSKGFALPGIPTPETDKEQHNA